MLWTAFEDKIPIIHQSKTLVLLEAVSAASVIAFCHFLRLHNK
jgi:hypothetical protein